MKIIMIGHKRIPSREGGVEIVVEELATRMVKIGHQVTAYNRGGAHVAGVENEGVVGKRRYNYKGIQVYTVPTSQKKNLNAVIYTILATFHAVIHHSRIVHFHAEGPCFMIPVARLFGKKCVATIHGLDWQRSKWGGLGTNFIMFGEKMAAKYANEIIVLSENVQKYFKETYNRDTVFIPNGIDIPRMVAPETIRYKYDLKGDDYILFLARIVPEKGLHYLIEAYKQLHTDKMLVIAGGSSHTDGYLEQIQESVKDNENIIMTGFIQGRELEELFSNCYAYVLPSDIEGMPISLLEALSYGRKCLVSDIPENVNIAKEWVKTFRKSDVEDLKEQLEKLLITRDEENSLYEPEKIRQYINEKYDWDRTVEETLSVYGG